MHTLNDVKLALIKLFDEQGTGECLFGPANTVCIRLHNCIEMNEQLFLKYGEYNQSLIDSAMEQYANFLPGQRPENTDC